MERREFLKRTGPAVALAAATGGTGLIFHNRETTRQRTIVTKTKSFEVEPDPTLPRLTLASNEDPTHALGQALDA
ncbi:MAG: twin-arginine translocation signal domain-containing protein, partial [Gemmatimonadales bacterium]